MRDDAFAVGWAIGLFEGEGSIGSAGHHCGVRLTLSSTDNDVVECFAQVVGIGRLRPRKPSKLGTKPMLEWQVDGTTAEALLRRMMPHFGARRLARADEVLEKRAAWIDAQTIARSCGRCGEEFRPPWTSASAQQRYCSEGCRRRVSQEKRDARRRAIRAERFVRTPGGFYLDRAVQRNVPPEGEVA